MGEVQKTLSYIDGLENALSHVNNEVAQEAILRHLGDTGLQDQLNDLLQALNESIEFHDAVDNDLYERLRQLDNRLTIEIANIIADIEAEAELRIQGDNNLQVNIDNEVNDRINAINLLQSSLQTIINGMQDALNQEILNRTAVDNDLQDQIDAIDTSAAANQLAVDLDAEIAARIAGDEDLQNKIDLEEAARILGDQGIATDLTELQNSLNESIEFHDAVDNDIYERLRAVDDRLTIEIDGINADINAEIAARIAGDNELEILINNINQRITYLESQDQWLRRLDAVLNQTDITNMAYDPVTDDLIEVIFVTGHRIELYYNILLDLDYVYYYDVDGVTHIFTQRLYYDANQNVIRTEWSAVI